MAWILSQKLSAEHGVAPGVIQALKESPGGLPDVQQYIKVGAILFPAPRHISIVWHIYPSKAAYLAHVANPKQETAPLALPWEILPEPHVIRREQRDPKTGEILHPALVLPSFNQLMANSGDVWNLGRQRLYEISADWPEFDGARLDE